MPFAEAQSYMLVGVFSVTLVAQFGSSPSDLYGENRGRRPFPLETISFLRINVVLALLWTALSIYLVHANGVWRAVAPIPASDTV